MRTPNVSSLSHFASCGSRITREQGESSEPPRPDAIPHPCVSASRPLAPERSRDQAQELAAEVTAGP
jgi:hypothetical protein